MDTDLLDPRLAKSYFRAGQMKNQARLLKSCVASVATVAGVGFCGAALNFWPAIAAGMMAGSWVLWREWREWRQWNPPPNPYDSKAGQALTRWIEAQADTFEAAKALTQTDRYGRAVADVGRQWLKIHAQQRAAHPPG